MENIFENVYNKNWKMMKIQAPKIPKTPIEIFWWFWGMDIFIGRVPFLKTIVLANILVWIIF